MIVRQCANTVHILYMTAIKLKPIKKHSREIPDFSRLVRRISGD